MVCKKNNAVKLLILFPLLIVFTAFWLFSCVSHAATMEQPDSTVWLEIASDQSGLFASHHQGYVTVDKKGCYFVDIRFKVTVSKSANIAFANMNYGLYDASLNLCGVSLPATFIQKYDGFYYVEFQAPVDVYYSICRFDLQLHWFYNDASFTSSSVSSCTFTIDAHPVSAAGTLGNRLNWLGELGYLNGNKAVVNSIENQSDKAHDDSLAEQQLQRDANKLQDENNKLQEKANKLQEEANKTQKNIFDKISDFFNGFFDNLGNTVKSWIIPTSEQLSAFLEEVNGWFGDRLGFIWYPFDLALQLVSAFAMGEASSQLTLPAFKLDILGTEYTIWNELPFDMDSVGIFQYVRYFTSALLCCGVAKMAINKWDSVIGGRNG